VLKRSRSGCGPICREAFAAPGTYLANSNASAGRLPRCPRITHRSKLVRSSLLRHNSAFRWLAVGDRPYGVQKPRRESHAPTPAILRLSNRSNIDHKALVF
jgi:hypothetical protein